MNWNARAVGLSLPLSGLVENAFNSESFTHKNEHAAAVVYETVEVNSDWHKKEKCVCKNKKNYI